MTLPESGGIIEPPIGGVNEEKLGTGTCVSAILVFNFGNTDTICNLVELEFVLQARLGGIHANRRFDAHSVQ
jgi:hypothetical protein